MAETGALLDTGCPASRGTGPAADPAAGPWPIDPDPALTNLRARQTWRFADGRAVGAEVGGVALAADDPRLVHLGIRRDAAGRAYPGAFARCPETGAPLAPAGPAPDPDLLDLGEADAAEIPLPGGVPTLLRAGRPAALYLFQDNLGLLEAFDGRGFAAMGRLPPAAGTAPAADEWGIAYAAAEGLVVVGLPQLGPGLDHMLLGAPGLRLVSTPLRHGRELLVLGVRDGRLALCAFSDASRTERDLGPEGQGDASAGPSAGPFAGPWRNRAGDAVWTGAGGFVTWNAGSGAARAVPWPAGFAALSGLAPWRDRADRPHQLGLGADGYRTLALDGSGAGHALDGPHLSAGGATYGGPERFDVPWQGPAEALTLGVHAGSLLVPLLAMARDTVLLALDVPGPRGPLLRGGRLPRPAVGHVLHHAHGVGLTRLPVVLEVQALSDAGALLHDRTLYLWSRGARRCHALRLAA